MAELVFQQVPVVAERVVGDNSSMLSSHPASSERAQHIRDRLSAEKTAGKVVKQ